MLIYSVIFINLAFIFYTIGVWGEKLQKKLKPWHLVLFYFGLVCDTTGTLIMESIAKNSDKVTSNLHGLTGIIAIILMLVHALWATFVLVKKDAAILSKFHRFSIIVWFIWLIPFVSGAISHML